MKKKSGHNCNQTNWNYPKRITCNLLLSKTKQISMLYQIISFMDLSKIKRIKDIKYINLRNLRVLYKLKNSQERRGGLEHTYKSLTPTYTIQEKHTCIHIIHPYTLIINIHNFYITFTYMSSLQNHETTPIFLKLVTVHNTSHLLFTST